MNHRCGRVIYPNLREAETKEQDWNPSRRHIDPRAYCSTFGQEIPTTGSTKRHINVSSTVFDATAPPLSVSLKTSNVTSNMDSWDGETASKVYSLRCGIGNSRTGRPAGSKSDEEWTHFEKRVSKTVVQSPSDLVRPDWEKKGAAYAPGFYKQERVSRFLGKNKAVLPQRTSRRYSEIVRDAELDYEIKTVLALPHIINPGAVEESEKNSAAQNAQATVPASAAVPTGKDKAKPGSKQKGDEAQKSKRNVAVTKAIPETVVPVAIVIDSDDELEALWAVNEAAARQALKPRSQHLLKSLSADDSDSDLENLEMGVPAGHPQDLNISKISVASH